MEGDRAFVKLIGNSVSHLLGLLVYLILFIGLVIVAGLVYGGYLLYQYLF